jgi:transcriptional regulator with XRE-family HTH domain
MPIYDWAVARQTVNERERELYKTIGSRIRKARGESELTQEALAAAVSLTRTSITNIEKGRQNLLVHKLIEIAQVLQIAPADLLPSALTPFEDIESIVKRNPAAEKDFVRAVLTAPLPKKGSRESK